jgi:hypothetical protein
VIELSLLRPDSGKTIEIKIIVTIREGASE